MDNIAVFTCDPQIKHTLAYLCSVVLKCDFEIYDDFALVQERVDRAHKCGLVVFDAGQPEADPTGLLKALKKGPDAPAVIVIQRQDSQFGAEAFLAGAMDVVTWPCNLREFACRILLRLNQPVDEQYLGETGAHLDAEAYIAHQASLTTSEAQVMRVLFAHDGSLVTRDEMSLAVDARPWRYGDRKFDVHVAKIRKKIALAFGDRISVTTVRSNGYILRTADSNIFERH